MVKRRPALFLDRDGTLVTDEGYMSRISQLRLLPNVIAGVKRIIKLGYVPVVVTNQSGISRGYFTIAKLEKMHRKLRAMLKSKGVEIEAIYFCPHQGGDGCRCRKPKPGMLRQAARELKLDLKRSVMIGDAERDIGAGKAVGATTIQVTSHEPPSATKPDLRTKDLLGAAKWLERRLLE